MSYIQAERIESIKVGMLGGISFFLADIIFLLLNNFGLAKKWSLFLPLNLNLGLNLALQLGISFFTGFLFAVTYRYIIRTDENPHLKDGAVFAFGLVRALVFVETSANILEDFLPILVLGIETIISFFITRLILDLAFSKQFIKYFEQ